MYLAQTIRVKLTEENTQLLKKPSKIFNTIKAAISGTMTPTEQRQATVMLSVIQRLNIALRKSGFDDLVSIIANDKLLFENIDKAVNNLEQSNAALVESFESGNIKRLNTLSLTVDGEQDKLRFLIHVNIVRKPKKSDTPVTIKIFAFINEFKQSATESEFDLANRVKKSIQSEWGNKQQSAKLAKLELAFEQYVAALQAEINLVFPAQSNIETSQKRLQKGSFKSKHSAHSTRYDTSHAYLPYFYTEIGHTQSFNQDDYITDKFSMWDEDINEYDDANEKSWFGIDVSSGAGDSSSDGSSGGSSCGSSCGGGCGS